MKKLLWIVEVHWSNDVWQRVGSYDNRREARVEASTWSGEGWGTPVRIVKYVRA